MPTTTATRHGVVTAAEFAAADWSRDAVRHALRTGRLERVAAGRFATPPAEHLDRFQRADLRLLRRAIAATLPAERVAVSHLAAALARDWPVWAATPAPCVTTWDPRVCRVTGVHLHRVPNPTAIRHLRGLVLTSATRTIVDIAREFGTEAALVPGDVALRLGAITRDTLTAEVAASVGRPGVAAARRVAALLDPRAESPLESRSRWHFDANGIPQPESQVRLYTIEGRFLGRVDHFWAEGVVGEADGASKYRNDPDERVREKRRQSLLEDVDLEVVRWGAPDFLDFRAATARIERATARARRRLPEGSRRWFAVPDDPRG